MTSVVVFPTREWPKIVNHLIDTVPYQSVARTSPPRTASPILEESADGLVLYWPSPPGLNPASRWPLRIADAGARGIKNRKQRMRSSENGGMSSQRTHYELARDPAAARTA
jgi:hypothetical protein